MNKTKNRRQTSFAILKSPFLKEMSGKGVIKIIGAGYDLNTGEVTFFE